MALSTYSELKSAVADFLNRSDLTAVVPTFISLAEAGMERVLRTRNMISKIEISVDDEYVDLPNNFLEMRSMKLLNQVSASRIDFITLDAMDNLDPADMTSGITRYVSVVGDQFKFYPVTSAAYDAELVFYRTLPKLSDSNTTNWLLSLAPDAYLYGALMQSAPYLKDDQRINIWAQLYTAAIQQLQTADERGATSGGILKARVAPFGAR